MTTIAIRTDADAAIGMGHLSRCLALAGQLARRGCECIFVTRNRSGWAQDRIEAAGHQAVVLVDDSVGAGGASRWLDVSWQIDARQTLEALDPVVPSAVVVDQYGLDHRWEKAVATTLKVPMLVIDGVGNRSHHCEILVDPTYGGAGHKRRFEGLVPSDAEVLAGVQYALLRREFEQVLDIADRREGDVQRLLIAFGGGDSSGAAAMAAEAVSPLGVSTTVVAGGAASEIDVLRQICEGREHLELVVDTDQMAWLMADADLAVGAAGTMMWERAFLGLPAVVVTISSHQRRIATHVETTGAIRYAGHVDQVTEERLREHLETLIGQPQTLRQMSEASRQLMGNAREVGTSVVADRIIAHV